MGISKQKKERKVRMDIQTAALEIIKDNLASDEARPHPSLTGMMVVLLIMRTGADWIDARKAIEAGIEKTEKEYSAPDKALDDNLEFIERMSMLTPTESTFSGIQSLSDQRTLTLGDLSHRILDLESALSNLLNKHLHLAQCGLDPEQAQEVITARKLLDQAEQREIHGWLEE
jgi:hypothetical protein